MSEIRYREDKPKECKYCYWGVRGHRCKPEDGCRYILPDTPPKKKHPCDGCAYANPNPCIGYCLKRIRQELKDKKDQREGGDAYADCAV